MGSMNEFNGRSDTAKEGNYELKDIPSENIQNKTLKEKEKKTEEGLRHTGQFAKIYHVCNWSLGMETEREGEREGVKSEVVPKEIMAENLPKLI